jgi:LPXTG-motif cell wall-anchored protein
MKKALTAALTFALILAFAVPALGATLHFYSNDARMDKVYVFVMEPDNGWAQPETGEWPGVELTAGADGWYSYDLINDPATFNYFVMFTNDHDADKENQIKWCFDPINSGQYTGSDLWLTTQQLEGTEILVAVDGNQEIKVTAYNTQAEAEAALGLGAADTPVDEAPAGGESPKTGDSDLIFIAVGALVLVACAAVVISRKVKA